MQAEKESMEDFAKWLSNQLGTLVTDATGLKAKYDLIVTWDGSGGMGPDGRRMDVLPPPQGGAASPERNAPLRGAPEGDSPPTIFSALQSQLGLQLEQRKGQVETIVVDHFERIPTEN